VKWINDMFGSDSEGTPNLARLLIRGNTEARPGEPVILRLNEKQLCPCHLQVKVDKNQVTEPQALESLAEEIERSCRRKGIEIIIRGDLADFVAKGGVGELLQVFEEHRVRDVHIIRVESGSIKLTLSIPEDQVERLFWLADSGALDRFGLLDFNYVPLEHEVPAKIPGVDLEAYHSYLLQRARFLLGDPRLPGGLDAEELASETLRSAYGDPADDALAAGAVDEEPASETLRSAYGTAETTIPHDVTGAEQLARLEKIQDHLLVDPLRTRNAPPGIGQPPAHQATEPPTADYVRVGDEAPPNLPGYKILMPPIGERHRWPKMGGMGVVWRARDLQFQRLLAVKVMKAESADSRRVRCFLREARITAQLAHPSIVPVHAMGRLADGRPYYTMKLVEGETLAEILQAEPDVASRRTELLQVFARVCEALAFAHRKRVIHLDLKPSNVMVGAHGEVQVLDWGLAKLLDEGDDRLGKGVIPLDLKPSNVMVGAHGEAQVLDWGLAKLLDESDDQLGVAGTWPYMSREQAKGWIEQVDRRSDVFGLGAMLCAILTGKPPYVGPTPEDVKRQAREADLKAAYDRLDECKADAELIALARACLSAERNDRPPDASAVEERLTGYLASVQERLGQAERDRAAAQARAEEAERTRRVAEEKAAVEEQLRRLAEKARRRLRGLVVGLACALLGLMAAGLFAWQAHVAEQRREDEKRQNAIDKALTAAIGGDLEAAEQAIEVAEQAGASAGQVRMLRGQIALYRGQSQKAIRHLEQAVRLLPDSLVAHGMLAAAYAWDGQWERYDKTIREMDKLTASTPEDFLFKGYAEANLEPTRGLQTIQQAFARRPTMAIARLFRAEVRALVAQDTDDLEVAKGAVEDARFAREWLGDKNPAALWVSLGAHLAKAGVHEHRREPDQRRAELELARKDADALKPFTALPEAVVYRWLYFREVGREEEVLEELRRASKETDHTYVNFYCAVTLYRRGQRSDLEEALRVLERRPGTYNDRLLPFVLAELDYPNKQHDWPARALKAYEGYTARTQDGAAVMDTQAVLYLLGRKGDAVEASKALLGQPERFYTLRRQPLLQCLHYKAGDLTADELVRRAGRSRWDQCLAHFSIAMTKLAEGDRTGAKEHFEKAVETRATGWGEYDMSWVFLARLKNDPTWPPWIPERPAK
jgi:tetratricopeptide (TPR) repeat protein